MADDAASAPTGAVVGAVSRELAAAAMAAVLGPAAALRPTQASTTSATATATMRSATGSQVDARSRASTEGAVVEEGRGGGVFQGAIRAPIASAAP